MSVSPSLRHTHHSLAYVRFTSKRHGFLSVIHSDPSPTRNPPISEGAVSPPPSSPDLRSFYAEIKQKDSCCVGLHRDHQLALCNAWDAFGDAMLHVLPWSRHSASCYCDYAAGCCQTQRRAPPEQCCCRKHRRQHQHYHPVTLSEERPAAVCAPCPRLLPRPPRSGVTRRACVDSGLSRVHFQLQDRTAIASCEH